MKRPDNQWRRDFEASPRTTGCISPKREADGPAASRASVTPAPLGLGGLLIELVGGPRGRGQYASGGLGLGLLIALRGKKGFRV